MFGHRPVSWGRHAGAVFVAGFTSSLVQVLLGTAVVLSAMSMTGQSLGPEPVKILAIATLMMWSAMFPLVLGEIALFFTFGRVLLTLARRNFGAAYVALGLVVGMVEASVLGVLRGGTSPREFVFAAATGVLGGFVYWMVAARDRAVVAAADRSDTSGVFR
jgi:hypothetical protein